MKLALREEIRALEQEYIEQIGFPSIALMETAGRLAADHILAAWRPASGLVRVACGRGNNGGDGFVIARILREAGLDVRVQLVGLRGELRGDAALHAGVFFALGGTVAEVPDGNIGAPRPGELQVDALLGTGLDRDVSGAYGAAVDALNRSRDAGCRIYAVDIPSGLDANTGRPLGEAVRADATGTFGLGKPGLYVTPGSAYSGDVRVFDIGLPRALVDRHAVTAARLAPGEPILRVPRRPADSHKGTFGHVLVFAGGPGKDGAADLVCRGALRAGAGLVTLSGPGGVRAAWPEVMHEPVAAWSAAAWNPALLERKTALVFGPGVGAGPEAAGFLEAVVASSLPLVLDADGLNLVAREPDLLHPRPAPTVLTPHPAEAGRLLHIDTQGVQADRPAAARALAEKFRAVVVLKGAGSIIACPDGRYWINASGAPSLAAGGMGDVLAGILGALLGAGMRAEQAACVGVYAHGLAGERAGLPVGGLRASEVADVLPAVLAGLAADP